MTYASVPLEGRFRYQAGTVEDRLALDIMALAFAGKPGVDINRGSCGRHLPSDWRYLGEFAARNRALQHVKPRHNRVLQHGDWA